ncbi:ABC transporter permease [Pilimelia columellifera]|uniref:ABC-2 family transporter protein n=1 Tax=Pilimelia columellifera subsp. columellifera TaxID=706583 RepID=A0ABN3NQR3_9ACTN
MSYLTASGESVRIRVDPGGTALFVSLIRAGFRRYATYWQAALAGLFTNTVFGLLRCYVLLAVVAGAGGSAAGYSGPQLVTYTWVTQGLLAVVMLWGWTDLSDRIRSGDIVTDLLRPASPIRTYLAIDLGRAAFALLSRFVVPITVGALVFTMFVPQRGSTWPLFVVSVALAVVLCFACRYLVNCVAYWLLDSRGPVIAWQLASGMLAGLGFPLRFLPDWLVAVLWIGTPFPSMMQASVDVVIERDPVGTQVAIVGWQAVWAVAMLALCGLVQRRAERRMVVQGG